MRERKLAALEEERRLMYVAITRAEELLFLTESEGYNFQTSTDKFPSRFLTEIQQSFLIREGEMEESLWKGSKFLSDTIDREITGLMPISRFNVGDEIAHQYLGHGIVIEVSPDGSRLKVRFGSDETSDRFIMAKALL